MYDKDGRGASSVKEVNMDTNGLKNTNWCLVGRKVVQYIMVMHMVPAPEVCCG